MKGGVCLDEAKPVKGRKNKNKVKVKREKHKGFFGSAIDFLADRFYGFLENSSVAGFFTGGERFKAAFERSFIYSFYSALKAHIARSLRKEPQRAVVSDDLGDGVGIFNENTVRRPLKTKINGALGSSMLLRIVNGFFNRLASLPVMSYGLFLLSFGISVTVMQALKLITVSFPAYTMLTMIQGILILLISIPMFISRDESVTECLSRSVIGGFILYDIMGVRGENKAPEKGGMRFGILLFMVGLALGSLSYYYSPALILLTLAVLIFAVRTVYTPELGVLLGIVLIPFVELTSEPATICIIYSVFVFACFILKVIAGRRSAGFIFSDFLVALFALICVTASVGTPDGIRTALMYLSFMLMYYVVRNLIKSQKWERRCVSAWIIVSCLVSLEAIAQVIAGGRIYVTSFFGSEPELAWYLAAGLIITFAKALTVQHHRSVYAAAAAIQVFALLGSGTWLSFIVTCFVIILFFMIFSKKTMGVLIVLIVAIPVVSCFFTGSQLAAFWRLAAFKGPSQAHKVEIWHISSRIAGHRIFCGTGLGRETFASVFSDYAPEGMAAESSMSLALQLLIQLGIIGVIFLTATVTAAAVSSFTLYSKYGRRSAHAVYGIGYFMALLAFSVIGIFYDIWDSEPIALMFWMLIGFSFSCAGCAAASDNYDDDLLDDVSCDISISYQSP